MPLRCRLLAATRTDSLILNVVPEFTVAGVRAIVRNSRIVEATTNTRHAIELPGSHEHRVLKDFSQQVKGGTDVVAVLEPDPRSGRLDRQGRREEEARA